MSLLKSLSLWVPTPVLSDVFLLTQTNAFVSVDKDLFFNSRFFSFVNNFKFLV